MNKCQATVLILLSVILNAPIFAQSTNSIWSLNGYGTLGAAHSSENKADYIPSPVFPKGPGSSYNWDAMIDTRAGVQLRVQPNDKLSGVLQVVAEKRFDGKFKPRVEWANLHYALTPSLHVRAGRIALGTYMVSDHRKVGHSLPWLRPPVELYRLIAITSSDGVDLSYQHNFTGGSYTATVSYGSSKAKEFVGLLEASNIWTMVHRVERGPLTLHASYSSAKVDYGRQFHLLWDGFEAFGPAGEVVSARYDATGRWSPFIAVGFQYDPGDWFVMTEWSEGDVGSDFGNRAAWYVSGGYRLGAIAPYVTFARGSGGHRSVNGLDATAFPPSLTPAINTLNESLQVMQEGYGVRQQTVSLGARWDVLPNVAFKGQVDHLHTRKQSLGTFINVAPGYRPREANIISITMDFVF
ncbi:MAG: hypothetical protein Q8L60_09880 [Gammaproteobacteria bacterium]|nr:hypothetical protein [Gammaproteobacteria bacterium]MDP2346471.1 hypothetical protein [Gammaproteobacteria bacterium]